MIYYRDSRLLREATKRHPILIAVMHDLDLVAEMLGWKKVVVTSIYRTLGENRAAKAKTLIHCMTPHRAADVRIRDVDPGLVERVGRELNRRWLYDLERPTLSVAFWEPHGDGPHLHVQVHPHTGRRA